MAHNGNRTTFSGQGSGQGNLAMAKFAALMNVNRCFQFVKDAKPSRDTVRWKDGIVRYYKRSDGKSRLRVKTMELENKKLCERIYAIMTDDRYCRLELYF